MLAATLALGGLVPPALAAGPGPAPSPVPGAGFTLPSGEAVTLQEVVRDAPGSFGPTWRYRFVMPSLGAHVPSLPEGGEEDDITAEDAAELDNLGLPPASGPFDAQDFDDAQMVTLEELEAEGAIESRIIIDLDADRSADEAAGQPRIPADPEVLLQDGVHGDLLWLCETVALPDLPPPGDPARPVSIVISVAERPVAFGEMAMDVAQQFEGFAPAEDGRTCIWEPW